MTLDKQNILGWRAPYDKIGMKVYAEWPFSEFDLLSRPSVTAMVWAEASDDYISDHADIQDIV